MPDSSIGNTTPLSGVTVQEYTTTGANLAAEVSARHVYKSRVMTDPQLNLLRKLMLQKVKSWLPADKANILSQYGFQPTGGDMDSLVVEALIVYMKEEELQQILKTLMSEQRQISVDYRKAEGSAKAMRRSAFTARNFEDYYKELRELQRGKISLRSTGGQVKKYLKTVAKGFKGNRKLRGNYKNLEKEVKNVLKEFYHDPKNLVGLAMSMDIDVDINAKRRVLEKEIIMKVLFYVELLTGKNKGMQLAYAISDPEPYNEILQYTSFWFLTGRTSPISAKTLAEMRQNARVAKAISKTSEKVLKKGFRVRKRTALNMAGVSNKKDLETEDAGILSIYGPGNIDELIAIASRLGIKVGSLRKVKIWKLKLNIYRKLGKIEKYNKTILKRASSAEKAGKFRKAEENKGVSRALSEMSDIDGDSTLEAMNKEGLPTIKFAFGKDGTVKTKTAITRAVPVIVVGQLKPAEKKKEEIEKLINADVGRTKEKERLGYSYLKAMFSRDAEKTPDRLLNAFAEWSNYEGELTTKDKKGKTVLHPDFKEYYDKKRAKFKDLVNAGTIVEDFSVAHIGATPTSLGSKKIPNFLTNKYTETGRELLEYKEFESIGEQTDSGLAEILGKKKVDPSVVAGNKNMYKEDPTTGKVSFWDSSKKDWVEQDRTELIKKATKKLNTEEYIDEKDGKKKKRVKFTKKEIDFLKEVETEAPKGVKEKLGNTFLGRLLFMDDKGEQDTLRINEAKRKADEVEKKRKEKLKDGDQLGSEAMSKDAVEIFGSKLPVDKKAIPVYVVNKTVGTDLYQWNQKLLKVICDALKMAVITAPIGIGLETGLSMAGLLEHAKGAEVKEKKRPITSFISGDSTNGKPNEERVDIDWPNRRYKVTPIPKFAKGGEVSEASSAKDGKVITPLSKKDKESPLSVGINSHLVSYTNKINGDDGSGKALKVFMVNGSSGEVETSQGKVLLGDLLISLDAKLSVLQALMENNNVALQATNQTAAAIGSAVSSLKEKPKSEPLFSGFTTSLDGILRGE